MFAPRPLPLMTPDDMERTGWLIIACACFVAVIFICIFGEAPQ